MIALDIAYPPSANRLWRQARGKTILSAEYDAWMKAAHWQVLAQRPGKISGPYKLTLQLTRPDRRARDLGNLEKAVSDLLESVGVIPNDHLAREIHLYWTGDEPIKGGACRVTIEDLDIQTQERAA
jgi:crossover junction endodeoxyribonuclease RusA